jgi:hypothetical protein
MARITKEQGTAALGGLFKGVAAGYLGAEEEKDKEEQRKLYKLIAEKYLGKSTDQKGNQPIGQKNSFLKPFSLQESAKNFSTPFSMQTPTYQNIAQGMLSNQPATFESVLGDFEPEPLGFDKYRK